MNGSFRPLVNPATRVSEIVLEETRDRRREVSEQVRLRAHLLHLLASAPLDDEVLHITHLEVVDGGDVGGEVAS